MTISYKDLLDKEIFSISKPDKKNGKWDMKVFYNKNTFKFQTPIVIFNSDFTIDCENSNGSNGIFLQFIKTIEESLIYNLSKNSKELFGGKEFSQEKIRDRLDHSWDIHENGNFRLLTTRNDDNFVVKDFLSNESSLNIISNEVVCIVKVTLSFTKKNFSINYKILKIKEIRPRADKNSNPFETEDKHEKMEEFENIEEITQQVDKEEDNFFNE